MRRWIEREMPVNVRMYRDEDFESVWPLFRQVDRFYNGPDALSNERIRAYVKNTVLNENSGIRLALVFEGEKLIGMATFAILHPGPGATGQLHLKEIFVLEQHRGKGAGKALMKFIAAYALEEDCSRLDWTGDKSNPAGLDFYRALGITPLDDKVYFRLSGEALKRFAQGRTFQSQ